MPITPLAGTAAPKGALVPIGNARLATTTASVTFSNIPQIYTDLMLMGFARSTYTADQYDGIGIYVNGDFSTVQAGLGRFYQDWVPTGTTVPGTFGVNTGLVGFFGWRLPPTTFGNYFTTQRYHILNYSNTNTWKTGISEGTSIGEGLAENLTVTTLRTNTAITSLTLQSDRGTGVSQFTAGTVLTLYGVRRVGQ